ncbi:MAG: hypothetical protein V1702_03305 [Candidatus Woesearchaeota archaeon]
MEPQNLEMTVTRVLKDDKFAFVHFTDSKGTEDEGVVNVVRGVVPLPLEIYNAHPFNPGDIISIHVNEAGERKVPAQYFSGR